MKSPVTSVANPFYTTQLQTDPNFTSSNHADVVDLDASDDAAAVHSNGTHEVTHTTRSGSTKASGQALHETIDHTGNAKRVEQASRVTYSNMPVLGSASSDRITIGEKIASLREDEALIQRQLLLPLHKRHHELGMVKFHQ